MKKPKIVAIIPARMKSSRFPNKPLFPILGIPMVEHVRRRVETASSVDDVWVATCDLEIKEAVESYGGKVIMTGDHHRGAADRVAEAAEKLEGDVFIVMQGDEPMILPVILENLVDPFLKDPQTKCTNTYFAITDEKEISDQNVVKVVLSRTEKFLYLSRSSIPGFFNSHKVTYFKQGGIIAFNRETLGKYAELKPTVLEVRESIDVIRLLENDISIQGIFSEIDSKGVDKHEQVEEIEKIIMSDPLQRRFFEEVVVNAKYKK